MISCSLLNSKVISCLLSTLNKKWHDKGELLSHLETQVKEVKEKFENKERKLKAERDKSLELQK